MGIFNAVGAEIAAQRQRLILWSPVALSLGIGAYFYVSREPPLWPFAALALGLFGLWFIFRERAGRGSVLLLSFFVALGFAAGIVRTDIVYTPVLQKKLQPVEVTGTIEAVEELEEGRGKRLLLYDLVVEKLTPGETPAKIRLTIKKDAGFKPGQRVNLLAALNSPRRQSRRGRSIFSGICFFSASAPWDLFTRK